MGGDLACQRVPCGGNKVLEILVELRPDMTNKAPGDQGSRSAGKHGLCNVGAGRD